MRTNYSGHEKAYQTRRAAGAPGWDDDAALYARRSDQLDGLIASGAVPREGRVLELGCGAGNLAIALARRGYEVHGVDLAPSAIDWARDKAAAAQEEAPFPGSVSFVVDDVRTLTTQPEGGRDWILDSHCLHCVIGSDRARFYDAVGRVLAPGGCVLIETMCDPWGAVALPGYDRRTGLVMQGDLATRAIRAPEDLRAEAEAAGFVIGEEVLLQPEAPIPLLRMILSRAEGDAKPQGADESTEAARIG